MKTLMAAGVFFFILALAACSKFRQPSPTAVPTFAFTALPTNTSVPPTQTPDAVSSLVPESQPASEWSGIPIMPGATAGEGDEESYVFTIHASPQQVQEYYQGELTKMGWQLFATDSRDSSLMLMFTNNASATLTISIIAKGDQVLVLLVN